MWIHSCGRGNLQDNEISGNYWHGVVVGGMAQPQLHNNRIHGNVKSGVFCEDGAAPTLVENDIYKNNVGVEAIESSEVREPSSSPPMPADCMRVLMWQPVLRGNKMHHHKMGAVWVNKEAKGVYEDNDMYNNGKARPVVVPVQHSSGAAIVTRGRRCCCRRPYACGSSATRS